MKKLLLIVACTFLFTNVTTVAYGLEIKDYEALITASKNNEPVELFSGKWIVGEDLEPGRYNITTTEGASGNIMIQEKGRTSFLVNDVLGYNRFGGSEQITVYLFGDETIEITSLDSVTFTPIEPEGNLEEIHGGNWIVGIDIEPGTYIATTDEGQSGSLFVSDKEGYIITSEILGENMFGGVDKVQLKLEEGYEVEISGLSNVYLTKE